MSNLDLLFLIFQTQENSFFKPGEGLHFYSGTEWTKLSGLVNGKLDVSQLPSLAITDTFVVASQDAMLAIDAQQGDVAIRTDIGKSFILAASPATTLSNWVELAQQTLVGPDALFYKVTAYP